MVDDSESDDESETLQGTIITQPSLEREMSISETLQKSRMLCTFTMTCFFNFLASPYFGPIAFQQYIARPH
jgi:hypothetical protein